MDNHTQYLGFAGVDLAKKVMQIHSPANRPKEQSFSISSETVENA